MLQKKHNTTLLSFICANKHERKQGEKTKKEFIRKSKFRATLALLVAVSMLLCMLPVMTFASDEIDDLTLMEPEEESAEVAYATDEEGFTGAEITDVTEEEEFTKTVKAPAIAAGKPVISFMLFHGGVWTPVSDPGATLLVYNGDKLEMRVDFSGMEEGDSYTIILPDVFLGLDLGTIQTGNSAIADYADFNIAPVGSEQTLTITFTQDVHAASFAFVGTLYITTSLLDKDKTITVDGEGVLTIVPNQPGTTTPGTIGVEGKPTARPIPGPSTDGEFRKTNFSNTITEQNFMESTSMGNAFRFILDVNYAQYLKNLNGTIMDELPENMKLFCPNAPGYVNSFEGYAGAYRSFLIEEYTYLAKNDKDGKGYYVDNWDASTKAKIVDWVNAQEVSAGRLGGYDQDDIDWRFYIPPYIADPITNEDEVLVTSSYLSVGYRKQSDNKIHLTAITTGVGPGTGDNQIYEDTHVGNWSGGDTDLFIPLRESNGNVFRRLVYTSRNIQAANSGGLMANVARPTTPQVDTSTPGKTNYTWTYTYSGETSPFLILTVIKDNAGGRDKFEVKLDINKTGTGQAFFGSFIRISPYIYFDRAGITVPTSGRLPFVNTASYNEIERTATSTYNYNFGSAGTVVAGSFKAVDKANLNPEAVPAEELTYSFEFKKAGALAVPQGTFRVTDRFDANLNFVGDSIAIYKSDDDGATWTNVTNSSSGTTATSATLNLQAAFYAGNPNQIVVTNPDGAMSFTGLVKIGFKTALKPGSPYGLQVTNTFGNTVKTDVDHKIMIKKTSDGSLIETPATFSIEYSDTLNGSLRPLLASDGSIIAPLSTTGGTASALYRLGLNTFFLKLTETAAPAKHIGLAAPIWIKAELSGAKWTYSIADAPKGVTISSDTNNMVILDVPNAKQPGGGGEDPGDKGGDNGGGGEDPGDKGGGGDDGDDPGDKGGGGDDGDDGDDGDSEPPTESPTEPPQTPGGNDPNVPPNPIVPGHVLVPGDEDGVYVELDDNGVPSGEWHWDDNDKIWIFEEYPPLSFLPRTGDGSAASAYLIIILVMLCFFLIRIVVILITIKPHTKKRSK